jgi:hypothetical protein
MWTISLTWIGSGYASTSRTSFFNNVTIRTFVRTKSGWIFTTITSFTISSRINNKSKRALWISSSSRISTVLACRRRRRIAFTVYLTTSGRISFVSSGTASSAIDRSTWFTSTSRTILGVVFTSSSTSIRTSRCRRTCVAFT